MAPSLLHFNRDLATSQGAYAYPRPCRPCRRRRKLAGFRPARRSATARGRRARGSSGARGRCRFPRGRPSLPCFPWLALVVGRKGERGEGAGAAAVLVEFLSRGHFPHDEEGRVCPEGDGEISAVRGEGDRRRRAWIALQPVNLPARRHFPQPRSPIAGRSVADQPVIWRPRRLSNRPARSGIPLGPSPRSTARGFLGRQ